MTPRDSVTTVTNSATSGDTKSMAVIHPYTPNYCLPRSLNINFNEGIYNRYSKIDQHLARHFKYSGAGLLSPQPFYALDIINLIQ